MNYLLVNYHLLAWFYHLYNAVIVSVTHGRPTAPSSSPPPAYEVAAPGHPPVKVPLEEPPPEYEAAMAMLAPEETGPTGPQLRKKSLTNHEV